MKNVFKRNGTRLAQTLSKVPRKPALALSGMLLASLLAGCQTNGTLTSVTDNEAICVDPLIRYSRKDTLPTVEQVRQHNAFHRRMGCAK